MPRWKQITQLIKVSGNDATASQAQQLRRKLCQRKQTWSKICFLRHTLFFWEMGEENSSHPGQNRSRCWGGINSQGEKTKKKKRQNGKLGFHSFISLPRARISLKSSAAVTVTVMQELILVHQDYCSSSSQCKADPRNSRSTVTSILIHRPAFLKLCECSDACVWYCTWMTTLKRALEGCS